MTDDDMTYQEALKVLDDFVLAQGYAPVVVFEALEKLEELIKSPELDSGVAIQTYCMAGIPVDPDIDARVEELARRAKKRG